MSLKIITVRPRGFCAGVNMALKTLSLAIEKYGPPIYVYHEIVHNTNVVDGFRARGVVFVDSLENVPVGSRLLFSAHGVSPAIRREADARSLSTIDASCPLVANIHSEAVRYAENGYSIVHIGHPGHDEVVGTLGEAPDVSVLVATVEDVERLPFSVTEKIAYLTQTTLCPEDAGEIITRLKSRYPGIVSGKSDNICFATRNRQEAIRKFATGLDRVLVIGSRNSSNSRRLAEVARSIGVDSRLIDGTGELDCDDFNDISSLLVTAGASAPEHLVLACIEKLRSRFPGETEERVLCEENLQFRLPEI